MLEEYDVTYVVKDDPEGSPRPWRLDLLPLLIDATEWQTLERGLVQRATLLNAIVADIYGAQRVLAEQLLPPAPPELYALVTPSAPSASMVPETVSVSTATSLIAPPPAPPEPPQSADPEPAVSGIDTLP